MLSCILPTRRFYFLREGTFTVLCMYLPIFSCALCIVTGKHKPQHPFGLMLMHLFILATHPQRSVSMSISSVVLALVFWVLKKYSTGHSKTPNLTHISSLLIRALKFTTQSTLTFFISNYLITQLPILACCHV